MPIAVPSTPSVSGSSDLGVSRSALPPAPTSRNAVRLTVAQRESPSGHSTRLNEAGPSTHAFASVDEQSALRRATLRKVQLQRRTQKWMDRLMEETVDRATFKRATSQFTPAQYLEVAHERHLNSLCSYPLCSNPPFRPYSTAKRFVISTRAKTIKPTEGNEEDGYCSKRCKVKGSWVEKRLSDEAIWLRTTVVEIDLLEELEERGEFVWDSEQLKAKARQTSESTFVTTKTTQNKPVVSATTITESSTPSNPVTALIASLAIHERPTPTVPPIPPALISPTEQMPLVSPSTTAQPRPVAEPSSSPTISNTTARDDRRAASAMVSGSTSQLANTLVNAAKNAGRVQQLEADSDEERAESDWERDMAWGEEDEETKALFEEARLARELMEGDD